MKYSLVDANVWVALLFRRHQHSDASRNWFATLEPSQAGIARITHLTVLRLLTNRSVMGADVLGAAQAWSAVAALLQDERVLFLHEPSGIDAVMAGLLRYRVPTNQLVNDAYLAAFAICSQRTLVSLDRGFRQFPDLDVSLIEE